MRHIFEWESHFHGFRVPAIVTPDINKAGNVALTLEGYVDGKVGYSVRLNPSESHIARGELKGDEEHLSLLWSTQDKGCLYWDALGSGLPDNTRYLIQNHVSDWLRYEQARRICDLQEIDWNARGCHKSEYYADCISQILKPYYSHKLDSPIKRTQLAKRKVFTYFIHSPTLAAIKIGISADVSARLSALRTGNPDNLALLLSLNGDQETALHKQFSQHHVKGEWFKDGPVLEWIASQNA